MIPSFKYYFYPFLKNLEQRGACRLYDLGRSIATDLGLSPSDLKEPTKGGKNTKHHSRLNYCASYLKKMKLVDTVSSGLYTITSRGKDVLNEFGEDMTLDDLRNLPEFIATQINATNDDFVYVKPHIRSGKKISAYVAHKSNFNSKNPNVEIEFSESYREKLKSERES